MVPDKYNALFIILVCFCSSFFAQTLKLLLRFFYTRRLDIGVLLITGGMPSSHSALVSCLSCLIGLIYGFNSPSFPIAVVLSSVIIYDAMGVRRSVGIQAKSLNNLNEMFSQMAEEMNELLNNPKTEVKLEKIKELLGHTPMEVIAGCIIGTGIAFLSYKFIFIYQ